MQLALKWIERHWMQMKWSNYHLVAKLNKAPVYYETQQLSMQAVDLCLIHRWRSFVRCSFRSPFWHSSQHCKSVISIRRLVWQFWMAWCSWKFERSRRKTLTSKEKCAATSRGHKTRRLVGQQPLEPIYIFLYFSVSWSRYSDHNDP